MGARAGKHFGHRSFQRAAGVALATAALFLALCMSASAAPRHLPQEAFGSATQPKFFQPPAIAVDPASGDVLVADIKTQTIKRFKPNGEPDPFPALGTNTIDAKGSGSGPAKTGIHPCAAPIAAECDETPQNGFFFRAHGEGQIAIAPPGSAAGTAGNIYVSQPSKRLVDVFSSGGEYLGQITKAGAVKFSEPVGVAVDPAGTLFVGHYEASFNDANRRVYRYVPTANPPLATDLAGAFALPGEVNPTFIAIGAGSSAGYLFAQGGFTETYKLDSVTGEVKCKVSGGQPPEGMAISPSGGSLFLARPMEIDEYEVSGSGCDETPLSRTPRPATGQGNFEGIAVGSAGQIFAGRSSSAAEQPLEVFGPALAAFPDVTTIPATEVTPTSATLNGEVTPYGVEVTECVFEYGLNGQSMNQSAPCEGPIPADQDPHPVSASISGLASGTSYTFRLKASNSDGHAETSSSWPFKTPTVTVTKAATEVTATGAILNAEVDPYGVQLSECLFEYGPTAAYGQTAPCAESPAEIGSGTGLVAVHAQIAGLAPGDTYHYRIFAAGPSYSESRGKDAQFATLAAGLTVSTGSASALGGSVATLNGSVTPYGEAIEECLFEYGPTAAYGQTASCTESQGEIGTGSEAVSVHASLEGLEPGAMYHYRLAAGPAGGLAHGEDETFTTLGPRVEAEWAEGIIATEATVGAVIDPGGMATAYRIEWGATTAYGHSTATAEAGGGSSSHTVTNLLEGLEPGQTYHYRFVALNHCEADPDVLCTAFGEDRSFTTHGLSGASAQCSNAAFRIGPSASLPDCRAYEMVSPLEKGGSDIDFGKEGTSHAQAALNQASLDGEKLAYGTTHPFGDAQSAPFVSQYIAARDPQLGWRSHAINPPKTTLIMPVTRNIDTEFKYFSPDLCQAWFRSVSEPVLAPGGVAGYANLYRREDQLCAPSGEAAFEAITTATPPNSLPEAYDELELQGLSADREAVLYAANDNLTDAEPPQIQNCTEYGKACQLRLYYQRAGDPLAFVCVLPSGEATLLPCLGGTDDFVGGQNRSAKVQGAISADGSRVYWTAAADSTGVNGRRPGHVYLRINPGRTQRLPRSPECHGHAGKRIEDRHVSWGPVLLHARPGSHGARNRSGNHDRGGLGEHAHAFEAGHRNEIEHPRRGHGLHRTGQGLHRRGFGRGRSALENTGIPVLGGIRGRLEGDLHDRIRGYAGSLRVRRRERRSSPARRPPRRGGGRQRRRLACLLRLRGSDPRDGAEQRRGRSGAQPAKPLPLRRRRQRQLYRDAGGGGSRASAERRCLHIHVRTRHSGQPRRRPPRLHDERRPDSLRQHRCQERRSRHRGPPL